MSEYANLPSGTSLDVRPFKAHVSEDKLQLFKDLLKLSPIAPLIFENTNAGRKYGVTRSWLDNAKDVWLNNFDWRKQEDRINSFPNFKASVKDGADNSIEVQFLALFSKRADAVPIAFFHGWPGSICEFLDILDILRSKYTADDLPYHVIVPSLPGYAYSSELPVDVDYDIEMAAGAMHSLMVGLGFGSGYLAQGGDLGSFVSRILAVKYDACKGIHLNMILPPPPSTLDLSAPDELERKALQKGADVFDTGMANSLMQGTRPSTLGLALSSSPLALLSWIGEKMLEWTDDELPLEKVLDNVTLYWMTDSISRCMYHSRVLFGNADEKPKIARISVFMGEKGALPYIDKPTGYSYFGGEIVPVPKSWAIKSCNIVSFTAHERGGHFAALEKPNELLADVEEYVSKVWNADIKP